MKRKIKPLWILYTIFIYWPLGSVCTAFTAMTTVILVNIGVSPDKLNSFIALWARIMCKLVFCDVHVEGTEHIDNHKSYIFLSNHQSLFDIFAIYGYIPNRFAWIMKEEVRRMLFVGKACEKVGHVFINRSSKMQSMRSIKEAEIILKESNRSVVLFPEGTRTRTGKVGVFKRGAFFIARDLHMPIVPTSLEGPYFIKPKGSWWVQSHRITLRFHEPIDTSNLTQENMQEYIEKVRGVIVNDLEK